MKKVFVSILLVFSLAITAQEKDALLPKANEEFAAKKYADAEANYRISHSKFPRRTVAYTFDVPEPEMDSARGVSM